MAKLKDLPKKGTIIKNLLDREDNMSLAVKILENGDTKVYWEVKSLIHQRASKELLDLFGREELYQFVDNICHFITRKFARNTFAYETWYPSRDKRKQENTLNIPHDGRRDRTKDR
jgi:hypothetical protein